MYKGKSKLGDTITKKKKTQQKQKITIVGKAMEKLELMCIADGM